MLFRSSKLQRWVDGYLASKSQTYPNAANQHKEWLMMFAVVVDKEIVDITNEDIWKFNRFVEKRFNTTYQRLSAGRAVSNFMRYYRNHGHKYLPTVSNTLRRL